MEQEEQQTEFQITLNRNSLLDLNITRKWTFFLSIMGFIFIGIMVLLAVVMMVTGTMIDAQAVHMPFSMTWFSLIYLIFAVIMFFPAWYLLKFSSTMKNALYSKNTNDIEVAFHYLMAHFRYMGIYVIVILALYAVGIIAAIVGASFFSAF